MSRHDLKMPNFGLGGAPMRLSLWLVARGAAVVEGEPVAEIVAPGVVIDLPAPATGILARKLVDEGDPVAVGEPLAVIAAP